MLFLGLVDSTLIESLYMLSALIFILGIKRLSGVRTARGGNALASLGMAIAIIATMLVVGVKVNWLVLAGGIVAGTVIGALLAIRVHMTGMPELVAFFNGMGGAASVCVALAEVALDLTKQRDGALSSLGSDKAVAIAASVLIGAVTLSGSLVAFGKLSGKIKSSRIGPIGSQGLNAVMAVACIALAVWGGFFATGSGSIDLAHWGLAIVALLLGIGLVVPIGGADMPVVISLLNSYSGLAACATGFVLHNNLLIVAGSLVGASGLILTQIMCKAMDRSLTHVLFAKFGDDGGGSGGGADEYTSVKSAGPEEAAMILDTATSVIIVPGYGMAVAQAQHKVKELATVLEARGCTVRYAIHPVAGRMPGHMNVLLAEADVPYEQLFELEKINGDFQTTDVAIVLGANDVVNPAAAEDPASPIAGMPVLHVWEAQTVFVIKRSLSPGYAGIKNGLFERENTMMCFGDAKGFLEELIAEVKEL
ncbi:MAG TPA: NAD(P)(+) transhydrogenase (Re/Si-specific) subunit beta [Planctomycetes bacterium]|nr:NAD(P)(+) transhydrogenase (Re/Si-specific) subunit beta [Planctomycetota bacterium]